MNKIKLMKNNQPLEIEYNNTMVFIGANGSGKSRLGAWIEQQNYKLVHRLSAQRNLSFKKDTTLMSFEQSVKLLNFGSVFENYPINYLDTQGESARSNQRWQQGKYTTSFLNDYDHLLSMLFAERNLKNEELSKKVSENIGKKIENNFKELSNIEILIDIWNKILPHRQIEFKDQKIIVKKEAVEYFGTELSDGERVIIYLIGQVLSLESGKILIVDEPEIHIHKSILNLLWDELESIRDDISILYITHDLEFAKERYGSKTIWVKSYDGQTNWDWEEFDYEDSEKFNQLHLEVLGSRKPVLFMEGKKGSLDCKVYAKLFPEHTVISVESCDAVVGMVSSYKKEHTLHNIAPVGIVDKDFRDNLEIEFLLKKGIKTLDILEIENIFALPSVIEKMYDILDKSLEIHKTKKKILDESKKIINKKFSDHFDKMILNMIHKSVRDKISFFAKPKLTDDFKTKYEEHIGKIDISKIEKDIKKQLKEADTTEKKLLYLDDKGLVSDIAKLFGIKKQQYTLTVIKNLDNKELQDMFFVVVPKLDK